MIKTELDYREEILLLIENKINYTNIKELLDKYHPYDLSRVFIALDSDLLLDLIKRLPDDFIAEVFEYFSVKEFKEIMDIFTLESLASIISEMDLDLSVDLIKGLKSKGIEILNQIGISRRKQILEIMQYKEDEIGSYLNDSFLMIDINFSIKEAMKYITENAHETDYISIIYITQAQELLGYIKLKDLISARAYDTIEDVMQKRFPKVYLHDDIEYVAKIMQETRESSIPIINDDNLLLGVVTHEDLMDITALAAEEDYAKFAGLSDYELDSRGILSSVKSRLPWLVALLFLSLGTSFILSFFDNRLASSGPLLAARLAVFLPLILDMSGNTGTQSLAVTIRYISKNDVIEPKVIRKMILREVKTGFVQGFLIGLVVFAMILVTSYVSSKSLETLDYLYAAVTSGSIFVALIISTTLGGLIPILMKRWNIDPAVASGPLITTVADIVTLTIYYAIGMSILLPFF